MNCVLYVTPGLGSISTVSLFPLNRTDLSVTPVVA